MCCNKCIVTRNIRTTWDCSIRVSLVPIAPWQRVQLQNGKDTPSHTVFEAQAISQSAGLKLGRTQEEMDTSYGTGCHITFACLAR